MRITLFISAILSLAVSDAVAQTNNRALAPVRIILVGDSTMAVGSGWGPGFSSEVSADVKFLNMAKGGRSSGSYRAEGSWSNVMAALQHNDDFKATYVLIQFGHNDQPGKPGRSTDLVTEFPVNMARYVDDVDATGAKAVLVTPLTRRTFTNGVVKNDLAPWAAAVRKIAAEKHVPLLDLNADSVAAVQKMGPAEADSLAMAPAPDVVVAGEASGNSVAAPKTPAATTNSAGGARVSTAVFDYTHLGAKGSAYFARMVAGELKVAVPDLVPYLR